MPGLDSTRVQVNQRAAQIAGAEQAAYAMQTQVQQTAQQLLRATPTSQARVQVIEAQRLAGKQEALQQVGQAKIEQQQIEQQLQSAEAEQATITREADEWRQAQNWATRNPQYVSFLPASIRVKAEQLLAEKQGAQEAAQKALTLAETMPAKDIPIQYKEVLIDLKARGVDVPTYTPRDSLGREILTREQATEEFAKYGQAGVTITPQGIVKPLRNIIAPEQVNIFQKQGYDVRSEGGQYSIEAFWQPATKEEAAAAMKARGPDQAYVDKEGQFFIKTGRFAQYAPGNGPGTPDIIMGIPTPGQAAAFIKSPGLDIVRVVNLPIDYKDHVEVRQVGITNSGRFVSLGGPIESYSKSEVPTDYKLVNANEVYSKKEYEDLLQRENYDKSVLEGRMMPITQLTREAAVQKMREGRFKDIKITPKGIFLDATNLEIAQGSLGLIAEGFTRTPEEFGAGMNYFAKSFSVLGPAFQKTGEYYNALTGGYTGAIGYVGEKVVEGYKPGAERIDTQVKYLGDTGLPGTASRTGQILSGLGSNFLQPFRILAPSVIPAAKAAEEATKKVAGAVAAQAAEDAKVFFAPVYLTAKGVSYLGDRAQEVGRKLNIALPGAASRVAGTFGDIGTSLGRSISQPIISISNYPLIKEKSTTVNTYNNVPYEASKTVAVEVGTGRIAKDNKLNTSNANLEDHYFIKTADGRWVDAGVYDASKKSTQKIVGIPNISVGQAFGATALGIQSVTEPIVRGTRSVLSYIGRTEAKIALAPVVGAAYLTAKGAELGLKADIYLGKKVAQIAPPVAAGYLGAGEKLGGLALEFPKKVAAAAVGVAGAVSWLGQEATPYVKAVGEAGLVTSVLYAQAGKEIGKGVAGVAYQIAFPVGLPKPMKAVTAVKDLGGVAYQIAFPVGLPKPMKAVTAIKEVGGTIGGVAYQIAFPVGLPRPMNAVTSAKELGGAIGGVAYKIAFPVGLPKPMQAVTAVKEAGMTLYKSGGGRGAGAAALDKKYKEAVTEKTEITAKTQTQLAELDKQLSEYARLRLAYVTDKNQKVQNAWQRSIEGRAAAAAAGKTYTDAQGNEVPIKPYSEEEVKKIQDKIQAESAKRTLLAQSTIDTKAQTIQTQKQEISDKSMKRLAYLEKVTSGAKVPFTTVTVPGTRKAWYLGQDVLSGTKEGGFIERTFNKSPQDYISQGSIPSVAKGKAATAQLGFGLAKGLVENPVESAILFGVTFGIGAAVSYLAAGAAIKASIPGIKVLPSVFQPVYAGEIAAASTVPLLQRTAVQTGIKLTGYGLGGLSVVGVSYQASKEPLWWKRPAIAGQAAGQFAIGYAGGVLGAKVGQATRLAQITPTKEGPQILEVEGEQRAIELKFIEEHGKELGLSQKFGTSQVKRIFLGETNPDGSRIEIIEVGVSKTIPKSAVKSTGLPETIESRQLVGILRDAEGKIKVVSGSTLVGSAEQSVTRLYGQIHDAAFREGVIVDYRTGIAQELTPRGKSKIIQFTEADLPGADKVFGKTKVDYFGNVQDRPKLFGSSKTSGKEFIGARTEVPGGFQDKDYYGLEKVFNRKEFMASRATSLNSTSPERFVGTRVQEFNKIYFREGTATPEIYSYVSHSGKLRGEIIVDLGKQKPASWMMYESTEYGSVTPLPNLKMGSSLSSSDIYYRGPGYPSTVTGIPASTLKSLSPGRGSNYITFFEDKGGQLKILDLFKKSVASTAIDTTLRNIQTVQSTTRSIEDLSKFQIPKLSSDISKVKSPFGYETASTFRPETIPIPSPTAAQAVRAVSSSGLMRPSIETGVTNISARMIQMATASRLAGASAVLVNVPTTLGLAMGAVSTLQLRTIQVPVSQLKLNQLQLQVPLQQLKFIEPTLKQEFVNPQDQMFKQGNVQIVTNRVDEVVVQQQKQQQQPMQRTTQQQQPPMNQPSKGLKFMPFDILPPSDDDQMKRFKIKKKNAFIAYIPEVKRKGKFVSVGRPTSKGGALRVGERVALTTLAATFRARPVTVGKPVRETTYTPSTKLFRAPKTPAPLTYVQRKGVTEGAPLTGGRLRTLGERRAIARTRGDRPTGFIKFGKRQVKTKFNQFFGR